MLSCFAATEGVSFEDISKDAPEPVCAALPNQELSKVYITLPLYITDIQKYGSKFIWLRVCQVQGYIRQYYLETVP